MRNNNTAFYFTLKKSTLSLYEFFFTAIKYCNIKKASLNIGQVKLTDPYRETSRWESLEEEEGEEARLPPCICAAKPDQTRPQYQRESLWKNHKASQHAGRMVRCDTALEFLVPVSLSAFSFLQVHMTEVWA